MKPPQGFDRIKFLVGRKFEFKGRTTGRLTTHFTAERLARKNPGLADEISIYSAHLIGLPPDELQALCDAAFKKLLEEERVDSEREEQERFFNQPYARANIAHWSKAAHWTLDEAIALSFGKAPEVVTWERIRPLLHISAFAVQYDRVRDLALRAIQWKQLYDPVLPDIFVAWVKRNDLPFPSDLEAALVGRGVQVARHDQIKSNNEELAETLREVIEARAAAEAHAVELQSKLDIALQSERPVSTRERESLLKLVMGMAIACYKFDPKASRSTVCSAIVSDLETVGISLDVDTVRKWLKVAAETVSVDKTE